MKHFTCFCTLKEKREYLLKTQLQSNPIMCSVRLERAMESGIRITSLTFNELWKSTFNS